MTWIVLVERYGSELPTLLVHASSSFAQNLAFHNCPSALAQQQRRHEEARCVLQQNQQLADTQKQRTHEQALRVLQENQQLAEMQLPSTHEQFLGPVIRPR